MHVKNIVIIKRDKGGCDGEREIHDGGDSSGATCGYWGEYAAHAATNDFTISNYHMKLELGRDSEQRSTLKTTETIMVQFPSADQSHGIERAIPTTYNGHSTSLAVQSVTDETGAKVAYSTYESNGNEVVRIGTSIRTHMDCAHMY